MRRARFLALFIALLTLVAGLIAVPAAAETEVVDTTRISVDSNGAQANGGSYEPAISADGGTIVYLSYASNLVENDTNGWNDVFAYDVATATTTRISVDSNGAQANDGSYDPAVSADGETIVYTSTATNLVVGDTNLRDDVFAYDVATGTTTRISVDSSGAQANSFSYDPAVSADGATITYSSSASNLVADDTNSGDVFTYDVATATTTRISVDSNGAQATGGSSSRPAISADGETIVYTSTATNLVENDTNGWKDVFAYDVATATTTRISVDSNGAQANDGSYGPAVSADGGTIVYLSDTSNLVADDTNLRDDVFAYDVATATTTRISVDSNGAQANDGSYWPAISADGTTITYYSSASNLVADDTNGWNDVFAYDVATATTTRISVNSSGAQANDGDAGGGYEPAISADGTAITYHTSASNLVEDDTNEVWDVFLTRLNRYPDGTEDCPTITGKANLDFPTGVGSARVVLDGQSMRVPFVSTGFVETGPNTADIFLDWYFPGSGVVSVVEHSKSTPTGGPFGHFGSTVEVLSGGVGEWRWAGTVDYAHSRARIESLSGVLCID